MYSNIDFAGEKNAFKIFLERLIEEDIMSKYTNTYIDDYEYNFRKFNHLDGNDVNHFEGTLRPVYTKIFSLYRP